MSDISIPKLLKHKDYITLLGTSLGLVALICACIGSREFLSLGFFLITISLGTDLIDGYIARKTKTVNDMGRELDSLSDSLTFGIVPAILTYQSFKTGTLFDLFIIIGAICFAIGAMLRLARFNILKGSGYTGVPTPISALLLIFYFYINYFYAFALGGNTYPFPEISSYLLPIFLILIGWFNITAYIQFDEKDKSTYLLVVVLGPLCPIFGIIGLIEPNFIISITISIFFLGFFVFGLTWITRGFILFIIKRRKTTNPSQ